MKKEHEKIASKLRINQSNNLRNYEKQSQKSDKRIAASEKLARRNFTSTVELRRKHLKAT